MSEGTPEVPDNLMPGEPGDETDTNLGLSEIEAIEHGCGTGDIDHSAEHDFDFDPVED